MSEENINLSEHPDPAVGTREWTALIELSTMQKTTRPLVHWRVEQDQSSDRPTDEYLAWSGFYGFIETPKPEHNPRTQSVVEAEMVRDDEAHTFTQAWTVVDLDEEAQEEKAEIKWTEIRVMRNHLLQQTDWTQLADIPEETKNAWTQYRQALRDIPSTNDNPWEIVWPAQQG